LPRRQVAAEGGAGLRPDGGGARQPVVAESPRFLTRVRNAGLDKPASRSSPVQSLKRHLGSVIDDAQHRLGGPLGRALSLLPVAHGIDGYAGAPGERDLRQPELAADAARLTKRRLAPRPGVVLHDLRRDLFLG
jgi:hypothetical protein